jgi:hypothetical protein
MKIKTNIKAGPSFVIRQASVDVDEDGFIQEPERWDATPVAAK